MGEEKENGQYRDRSSYCPSLWLAYHYIYLARMMMSPAMLQTEWEHKLQPCVRVGIKTIEKACLHTQVQIESCNEDSQRMC